MVPTCLRYRGNNQRWQHGDGLRDEHYAEDKVAAHRHNKKSESGEYGSLTVSCFVQIQACQSRHNAFLELRFINPPTIAELQWQVAIEIKALNCLF